jgi:3-isopropylmalate/(R)-2-methylmalate dehydratase small subunit
MEPFATVTGIAASLLQPDIDTDVIMPKQFLKGIDRDGLRDGFLHDLRFRRDGTPCPEFILNRAPWHDATFLVVGRNFGCGSSREHAVWGMRQFGIRALLGTTFGGIFQDNCLRNGLLTISLPGDEIEALGRQVSDSAGNRLTVDLPLQTITVASSGRAVRFAVDALQKELLLQGIDLVESTLRDVAMIEAFEGAYRSAHRWLR